MTHELAFGSKDSGRRGQPGEHSSARSRCNSASRTGRPSTSPLCGTLTMPPVREMDHDMHQSSEEHQARMDEWGAKYADFLPDKFNVNVQRIPNYRHGCFRPPTESYRDQHGPGGNRPLGHHDAQFNLSAGKRRRGQPQSVQGLLSYARLCQRLAGIFDFCHPHGPNHVIFVRQCNKESKYRANCVLICSSEILCGS